MKKLAVVAVGTVVIGKLVAAGVELQQHHRKHREWASKGSTR